MRNSGAASRFDQEGIHMLLVGMVALGVAVFGALGLFIGFCERI